MKSYASEIKCFSDKISTCPLRTNTYTHFKIYRPNEYAVLLSKVNDEYLVLLFKIVDLLIKIIDPQITNNFENQLSMQNLSPKNYGYLKFFVSRVVSALYNPDIPFPNIDHVETLFSSDMGLLRRYIAVNGLEQPGYEEVLKPFFRFLVSSET